jgi:hypothetical protein
VPRPHSIETTISNLLAGARVVVVHGKVSIVSANLLQRMRFMNAFYDFLVAPCI